MTARLTIHLDAIRHNVATLAAIAAPSRTLFAVKAGAYGLGMVPVARAGLAAGAEWLGTLEVPAALELREAGIRAPLFAWLHGEHTDFRAAIEAEVDLGVSSQAELRRVAAARAALPARVHLKVDTGLHRNGANPADWPGLVAEALELVDAGALRIVGLWSHLADASPEADAAALAEFHAAVAVAGALGVPLEGPDRPLLHLAASSAGIREPEARLDLVRFGIAAYGVSPFDDVDGPGLGMRGTLSLHAAVIEARDGIAVLDVGSADGVPPSVLGPSGLGAEVLLGGSRARVLAVGIDTLTVEADAAPGDAAIVYGPGELGEPTVEDWAAWSASIGDEILARASTRLPREYLD
ncbi:alanine racemase [Protaetiibacter intestinalis]|uniref:Alanine racemase n=1 Tax=Protaetiibacter intestinalis TaxID=2419774 RepID=A0A387BB73_9MICO|nr:alanine racemase [Protaetiibacter intestinalis]AYF99171.1 alanine racemase [Protaetiibacter intestinalis]